MAADYSAPLRYCTVNVNVVVAMTPVVPEPVMVMVLAPEGVAATLTPLPQPTVPAMTSNATRAISIQLYRNPAVCL